MLSKFQRENADLLSQANEESKKVVSLQMEVAAKDSEIEQLRQRVALHVDNASVHSNEQELEEPGKNQLKISLIRRIPAY